MPTKKKSHKRKSSRRSHGVNSNTNKINIKILGGGSSGGQPVVVHHPPFQQQPPISVINRPQTLDTSTYDERVKQQQTNEQLIKSLSDLRDARLSHFTQQQPPITGINVGIPELKPTVSNASMQTDAFHDPKPTSSFTPSTPTFEKIYRMGAEEFEHNKPVWYQDLLRTASKRVSEKLRHYDTEDHEPSVSGSNAFTQATDEITQPAAFKTNQDAVNRWESLGRKAIGRVNRDAHEERLLIERTRKQKRDSYHRVKDYKRIEKTL